MWHLPTPVYFYLSSIPSLLTSQVTPSIAGNVIFGSQKWWEWSNRSKLVREGTECLCRRRCGVKHSNQNWETHQTKNQTALGELGSICWCWSVHVGFWWLSGGLERLQWCFAPWRWVGLWGSLHSITVTQFNKLQLLTDRGEGRGALQLNGCKQLPWLVVAAPVGGWGPWGSTVRWGRIGSSTRASIGGVHKGTIRGRLGINYSQ